MDLKAIKCRACGAALPADKIGGVIHCPFCGTDYIEDKEPLAENDAMEIIGGCLVRYTGVSVSPRIPPSVVKIGKNAFSDTCITSIIIPSGVKTIEAYAFSDCRNLAYVSLPDSLEEVGTRAFCRCSLLTEVDCDANISIRREVFVGTPYLDKILTEEREARIQSYREGNAPPAPKPSACYIATAVYGSYDCPEGWILRRFRDTELAEELFGRLFIRVYYAVSPTMVRVFGKQHWFQSGMRALLDRKVRHLRAVGYPDTKYRGK